MTSTHSSPCFGFCVHQELSDASLECSGLRVLSLIGQVCLVVPNYRSFIHSHVEFRLCTCPGSGFEVNFPDSDSDILPRQLGERFCNDLFDVTDGMHLQGVIFLERNP